MIFRSVPWREMGVLMRTMGSLEIVLDELRDAGHKITTEKVDGVRGCYRYTLRG